MINTKNLLFIGVIFVVFLLLAYHTTMFTTIWGAIWALVLVPWLCPVLTFFVVLGVSLSITNKKTRM